MVKDRSWKMKKIHNEKHEFWSYLFRAGKEGKVQLIGYIIWKREEEEEEIKTKFKYISVYYLTASLCNPQSKLRRSTYRPEVAVY
jgi:hypothetical protein